MNLTLPILVLAVAITFCGLGSQNSAPPAANSSTITTSKTPLDRASVQTEVVGMANDILNAAHKGDVDFLERSITDDFESTDIDGKVQNKRQALAEVKAERVIKHWAITEPDLVSFDENSAALRYVLSVTGTNGRSIKARTTDTYTRRGGRWLLKSQQMTVLK